MSVELFVSHPLRYALSAMRSWIDFWTVPILWQPEQITPRWIAAPLSGIWWIEHKILRLANVAFVLLTFAVVCSRRARVITRWSLEMTTLTALILLSSVVQALADYGASSRYAVTIQALVLLVVMAAWFNARGRLRVGQEVCSKRRNTPDNASPSVTG